ncbi:hypothetical protein B0H63DRAFT_43517 [Podospora didyma]|uniref:Uncharacterized protein n=1 Tax=Podospora didyma TaxID=330526 RepID=A0AAE0P6R0_9PEZI|nr:hypothetical protein B0H63DRAFT_43517 [Podospora didyma]
MSAAAVLLTSFAVAPLTQAAVSYPTRLSEGSGVAMAAMSDSYTPSKTRPVLNDNLDAREKQAIQIGLYHAVGAKVPHISPICSSGECYWRNFSTLAVCAAVVDVSDKLVVSEQTSPSTLGISLGVGNGDEPVHNARLSSASVLIGSTSTCNLNMSSPVVQAPTGQKDNFLPAATSLAFSESDARVSSAVANFFVVYTNQTADLDRQSTAFRAAEVLLHFCVNKYEVSTAQGVSITTLIGSSTVVAVEAEEAVPVAVAGRTALSNASENLSNSGLAANVVLRSTADNKDYSVQRDDVRLLNRYIQTVFSGTYSYRHGTRIAGWTAAGDVFGTAMFERDEESGGTTSFGDPGLLAVIGNVSQNVATSMTNAIRAIDNKEDGIVLITESYIRVQWSWLAFLASQVAISTMFLLGIMVQTAVWKVKIVKGSAIATLFAITAKDKAALELERGEGEESPGMDFETNGMTRKLESLTCRLTQANRGWALDLARREIEGT